MRPLSQVLTELIVYAEKMVTLRANVVDFSALAAEIRHADTLPAEGQRATRAAIVMITAIEAYRATDGDRGSPWLMIAAATLPLLRADAWVALNQEKEQRANGR